VLLLGDLANHGVSGGRSSCRGLGGARCRGGHGHARHASSRGNANDPAGRVGCNDDARVAGTDADGSRSSSAITSRTVIPLDELEVCAGDTGLVRVMENKALVTHESWRARSEGEVVVGIVGVETREVRNGAVFAAEIADLASCGLERIAWNSLASVVGIEMGQCSSTAAIAWNGIGVDVVDCRASS
jgi:hypothetical protein